MAAKKTSQKSKPKAPSRKALLLSNLLGRRFELAFIVVFCVIGGYLLYASTHASTSEYASGMAKLCLDDRGGNTADGSTVDIYTCNGSPAQHWTRSGNQIKLAGKCLDAVGKGTTNGTRIVIHTCTGNSNQQWTSKGKSPDTELVNVNANKCLDDNSFGRSGTALQLYTCNGGSNQRWYPSFFGASVTNGQSITAAKNDAHALLAGYGWNNSTQYNCLDNIYVRESGWRYNADNPTSSAYGVPQALPGSKMASAGSNWATNPGTQIKWGLGYIKAVYGTPCGAWSHWQANHSY